MSSTSGVISQLSGWISIGCWLGAQFPQVFENIRRQSCDGLALPFLLNWLLGDFTNLVGCLLTHQLPFQTVLATYFVSVDFMLFSQYFYYRRRTTKLEAATAAESGSGSGSLPPSSPVLRYSVGHTHGRRTSTEHDQQQQQHHHHYREISSAAADVAIAAALAAASEEELLEHFQSKDNDNDNDKDNDKDNDNDKDKETLMQRPSHCRSSTSITRSEAEEAEDEVDEDALAALADSFHSEGGRKRVSWSQERYGSGSGSGRRGASTSRTRAGLSPLTTLQRASSSTGATAVDGIAGVLGARGRPLQRHVVDSPVEIQDVEANTDAEVRRRSLSRSVARARRNSRASQRGAGLVFLGVWALFGIGSLSSQRLGAVVLSSSSSELQCGTVLSEVPKAFSAPSPISLYDTQVASLYPHLTSPSKEPILISIDSMVPQSEQGASGGDADSGSGSDTKHPEEPSSERIVGRVFAWSCTTLYLTSRLPQIWKNYVRKSVEGLSMYLFVFAFLGNTFYVLSILSSPMMAQPRPAATAFLLESMPYLLGSGGTLLFDVTIVSQSFLYRARPGYLRIHAHTHTHTHTHSHSHAYPHPHPHAHPDPDPHHRQRSSYSRSSADAYANQVQKTSPVSGCGSVDSVREEEQALLRSSGVWLDRERERECGREYGRECECEGECEGECDLERGGGENEWSVPGLGQTRRRRDVGEEEDGES